VIEQLQATVKAAGGGRLVKLNLYAASQEAADAAAAEARRVWKSAAPAVAVVVGALPVKGALVAADAVAVVPGDAAGVKLHAGGAFGSAAATLPAGPRVYVSGQAEKGATPAEAARNTLAGLRKTLDWLGCKPADVVQAKAFLTPVASAGAVAKEFAAAFGDGKVPPLAFVEWKSSLPVEIELVAAAPSRAGTEVIEFLTPPGMTASPVYARVTRINAGPTIYTAGLYPPQPGTGEEQVAGVFDRLEAVLTRTGSDFRHLAKATYYVSADDASRKLNELRPRYYDPRRPPAASKAVVPGVGMAGRAVMLDMIAVPEK
jgi:enamine deaminase RidA (YjgF/YER057c/UK114 family)